MKTSTAIVVVAVAGAALWLLGKQQEAALAAQLAAAQPAGNAVTRVLGDVKDKLGDAWTAVFGGPSLPDQFDSLRKEAAASGQPLGLTDKSLPDQIKALQAAQAAKDAREAQPGKVLTAGLVNAFASGGFRS